MFYSCDNWNFSVPYPCVYGGGNYYQFQGIGLFYSSGYGATYAYANIGCR